MQNPMLGFFWTDMMIDDISQIDSLSRSSAHMHINSMADGSGVILRHVTARAKIWR